MTYVITRSCCNDASCVEVCPVDCIHPTPDEPDFVSAEMLYIHPDECIDCGACVAECPVGAIYPEHELPEHLAAFADVNAAYFDWVGDPPAALPRRANGGRITDRQGPLRVAIVGAGPSGWYAAEELLANRRTEVQVSVFDRLPTPFGLVRHGVAPDHLATKGVADGFARTAARSRVRMNVTVGKDVDHEELLRSHHAVIYATGAPTPRALGVAGESLPGSTSAAELVGWYNGHPDQLGTITAPDHERAVVIGNGNVALDIARLLLATPEALAASDMSPAAVEALADGTIREVVVLGRRGPEHAAFTSPELRVLLSDPDLEVVVEPADLAEVEHEERDSTSFAVSQKLELLRAAAGRPGGDRRLVLRFGATPVEVLGSDRVTGVRIRAADGAEETLETGLVVRAIGYQSEGVPGAPVDEAQGRYLHEAGRVLDPDSGEAMPATYAVGWAKRGARGVLGTNRGDAAETVATLLDDYAAGRLPETVEGPESLDELLADRGVQVVDWAGWSVLDAHELSTGADAGRPRLKVIDRDEQLRIALGV